MEKLREIEWENNFTKEKDTCCFFIPIKLGMQILGVLTILSALSVIFGAIQSINIMIIMAIFMFVVGAVMIVIAKAWFEWLKDDSSETREKVCEMAKINVFV